MARWQIDEGENVFERRAAWTRNVQGTKKESRVEKRQLRVARDARDQSYVT